METEASIDTPELDRLQTEYRMLAESWIAAIRHEAELAAQPHSVAEIDAWEAAAIAQDEIRHKVIAAKEAYESALREEFFGF